MLELTKTPPPLPTFNPHFVALPVPLKVGSISSPTNSSELDPDVKVGETTKPRAKDELAVTLGENVLSPVNVCAPVETKPGLVALAAERVNVVPLIVPPVEYDVALVYVIVFTPEGVDETQEVPFEVNTFPDVPGLVKPVPPLATAIAVPLHTPEVMVPTPVKLELTTLLAKVVPVNVFASAAIVISALPSNATPFMFLVAANFVAVLAFPVKDPVNPVEVTEVNPVTEVTVPPKVIVVLPNVVELFANCAFVIAALLARLLVVKPVAEIVPALIEIPEPAVNAP